MKFIKEVFQEMKRVTWSSAKEVNHFTWIVIMMIVVFSLFFSLTDVTFTALIDWITKLPK